MMRSNSKIVTARLAKRQQITGSNYGTVIRQASRQFKHTSGFMGDTQSRIIGKTPVALNSNYFSQIPFNL